MSGQPFRSLKDPETLRVLVSNLPAGVYITTQTGEILDVNSGCLKIFGVCSLEELRRITASDLLVDPLQREKELLLLERDGSITDFEMLIRRVSDGQIRTVLDTCYAVEDPKTGETLYQGILLDITERKLLEEKLRDLTIRDPLTGCYNRRYLDELSRRLERGESLWGAIVVDIDHFKQYNDRYGHKVGDEVLVRMSRYLFRQVRAEDVVVRIGGDEFLVLLLGEHALATEVVARRLEQQPQEPAPVSFSLGWAVREEGESLDQTISRSDRELIHIRKRERSMERRGQPSSKVS